MKISEGMVAVLIFVRRPQRRDGESTQKTASAAAVRKEPLFKGIIRSPTADGKTTESLFECQVGDMIFLHAGERVLLREVGEEDRDICFYLIAHKTIDLEGSSGEGAVSQH